MLLLYPPRVLPSQRPLRTPAPQIAEEALSGPFPIRRKPALQQVFSDGRALLSNPPAGSFSTQVQVGYTLFVHRLLKSRLDDCRGHTFLREFSLQEERAPGRKADSVPYQSPGERAVIQVAPLFQPQKAAGHFLSGESFLR